MALREGVGISVKEWEVLRAYAEREATEKGWWFVIDAATKS